MVKKGHSTFNGLRSHIIVKLQLFLSRSKDEVVMHHRQLVVMHRIHILEKPTLQFEKPLATQVPHLKLPSLLCGTVLIF